MFQVRATRKHSGDPLWHNVLESVRIPELLCSVHTEYACAVLHCSVITLQRSVLDVPVDQAVTKGEPIRFSVNKCCEHLVL